MAMLVVSDKLCSGGASFGFRSFSDSFPRRTSRNCPLAPRHRCSVEGLRAASGARSIVSDVSESFEDPVLIVVGGGAAGIFGALRAKTVCPQLTVVVLEKGKLLSKVRISGGGRCNVTTGLHVDPLPLAGQYPRGHKELRGSFFRAHGPRETIAWFAERGVSFKKEEDGRMFPTSNSSATVVDCLLNEARRIGVVLRTGVSVSDILCRSEGGFLIKIAKSKDGLKKLGAHFVLLSTGSSRQGHELAEMLGHSIVEPQPSLFTFKVMDAALAELAGVSFEFVKADLELPGQKQKNPHLSQTGSLLITHWGLSGPAVLRLSAWAARDLFSSNYQGTLWIDFVPSMSTETVYGELESQKKSFMKRKVGGASPLQLPLTRRFWQYLLQREDIDIDSIWATLSSKALRQLANLLKRYPFPISGKGEFKDEFVTSGGVPLVEVNLKTMESRICRDLYLAGEVLDIDGVTGGFNFQNAWTGGYISGSEIGSLATARLAKPRVAACVED